MLLLEHPLTYHPTCLPTHLPKAAAAKTAAGGKGKKKKAEKKTAAAQEADQVPTYPLVLLL
jgi:hypothetical protein